MEIKKIRESRGMLQYELANRMGVKQASVSAWESGRPASAENLLKLADILELHRGCHPGAGFRLKIMKGAIACTYQP